MRCLLAQVLFDIGTGRYKSGSLPWFMNIFEAKGIVFDEIYGAQSIF